MRRLQPSVVSSVGASSGTGEGGEQKHSQGGWRLRLHGASREQFQKSDRLGGLGSEARGHRQHLQKYLLMGRKKQREQAELERRLREETHWSFLFLEIKLRF